MRSTTRRFLAGALFAAGVSVFGMTTLRAADPNFQIWVDGNGTRWLAGCASADVAPTLLANGFTQSGPADLLILCIEGYSAVYRQLGN
jgi:hypothetical protein